ncbi:MAG: EF-Tu/IF-2/RF-3 family GTPase [Candidatus Woesearchaeota archaeon]
MAEEKSEETRKEIGEVLHYYSKIGVGVLKLSGGLKVGDEIEIRGATTGFKQKVDSMQVDHEEITEAKPGDEVGIKLAGKAREGGQGL